MQSPAFQISVTTHEFRNGVFVPLVSHIFYGQTLEEAYTCAKSHLITDYFFSSSFIGNMLWKNVILQLSNTGTVTNVHYPATTQETQQILNRLTVEAQKIRLEQDKMGSVFTIMQVANCV